MKALLLHTRTVSAHFTLKRRKQALCVHEVGLHVCHAHCRLDILRARVAPKHVWPTDATVGVPTYTQLPHLLLARLVRVSGIRRRTPLESIYPSSPVRVDACRG